MTTYRAPVDDLKFVLHELLQIEQYGDLGPFARAPREVTDAVIEEGARFVEGVVAPLNAVGDREGCTFHDGVVTSPTGFKDAYRQFVENGWGALNTAPDHGGQGLPGVVAASFAEMLVAGNMAFSMYPTLTEGAYAAISAHGSELLRSRFLPKLATGEWTGTMNLTEPQAGTDLSLLKTRAERADDGTYRIFGTKIFISAGEHDLAENIVHLVLARIPGAPAGTRGISLFIVPKFLVNEDGSLGARNAVQAGAIEEKMGIHGNATCVMNYDGAVGYLVGGDGGEGGGTGGGGLRQMFTMMNLARIGVGQQGVALAEAAYQQAAAYARERLQSRAPSGATAPDQPADPIIAQPDVRRMLLKARAFIEGGRALGAWLYLNADLSRWHPDADRRKEADALVQFLTPVYKAYLTDMGFEATNLALQCFGGYGYIREIGVEQYVRDARIAMIYEGTNGVQAMDLVGRKLANALGNELFGPVAGFVEQHNGDAALERYVAPLATALGVVREATMWIAQHGPANPDEAGAAASDYLRAVGLLALGYMWGRTAEVAQARLAERPQNAAFYERKLVLARFFMDRMLPETQGLARMVQAGGESMMALPAEQF